MTLPQPDAEHPGLTSPKRAAERSSVSGKTYPYYAGFSEDFVHDVLRRSNLPQGARVLDPWNGSGTTVKAASQAGVDAHGFDLNPVMVAVARARLCTAADFTLATGSLSESSSVPAQEGASVADTDPLEDWVEPATASELRSLISEIIEIESTTYINDICAINTRVDTLPAWRCLMLVAAFRALKTQLGFRDASNPTWTVVPAPTARRKLDIEAVRAAISAELDGLQAILAPATLETRDNAEIISNVRCSSSENLPLHEATVDLVVTSPPYCTRIDYAKATLFELALLGLSAKVVDAGLRRALIGTTAIRKDLPELDPRWGTSCIGVLDYTYSHSSKGSRSYYYKNLLQYFDSMFKSMKELARVCKSGAYLYIVVQESYYKEKKIDLPTILCEMGTSVGISTRNEVAFPVRLSMVNINTKSRRYRQHSDVDEKVLILQRD